MIYWYYSGIEKGENVVQKGCLVYDGSFNPMASVRLMPSATAHQKSTLKII